MTELQPFDISRPVPGATAGGLSPTTTLLEASAGTGKTWTIAALVTRYVAEGHATIDQVLAVTFTKAATTELRDRVRTRLAEVADCLDRALAGEGPTDPDELVAHLVDGPAAALAERRDRLREAVASFDTSTIVTIHQFCQLVLKGLGIAGDTDPRATLVEDLSDLRKEVVDDLWLRDYSGGGLLSHDDAGRIAKAIVDNPGARLEPQHPTPGSTDEARVRFAREVAEEFDHRKRRLGVLSFDDLLVQLRDVLVDADAIAGERMRDRWKVVLIDEFQDTDPVQWEVFARAFHGHGVLVLIGDPKQAIYAFRGGDVFTYLKAADVADTRQTLSTNQRSDHALVEAVHKVLDQAQLGDPLIAVHPIEAARPPGADCIRGLPGSPFQLRALLRADLRVAPDELAKVDVVRPRIAADAAAQVRHLLGAGAEVWEPDAKAWTPLTAGHIAVLAHTRRDLELVQDALRKVGVPAVITGGQSVFATPAGAEWRALLEAMAQPHRARLARAAGATAFFGHTGSDLDAGGEALTDRLSEDLRDLALTYAERGVAAVFESLVARGFSARVLGTVGGERHLTDLRHLSELLHDAATRERLGLAGLIAWFLDRQREANDATTERTRRIDSDARAVQLVTIHGSKGLEYSVVLAPFVSDRFVGKTPPDILIYHDDDRERVLHVGDPMARPAALVARHRAEDAGESLRMLYVAMTRARSRLVTWWAAGTNVPCSALHRVLFGRKPGTPDVPDRHEPPSDEEAVRWLRRWADPDIGGPELARAEPGEPPALPAGPGTGPLAARTFDRRVDQLWRRTSYSALAAVADEPPPAVGSEPEVVEKDDEPEIVAPPAPVPEVATVPSPLAAFPSGARFGSLVHAVLEHADPAAPDWRAEVLRHVREQLVEWPVALDPEALADGLVEVCDSPLGPLAGELTLRQLPLADRLCELDFELPIGGGDSPVPEPRLLGDVAALLRRHLPAGDPLLPYADALDNPVLGGQVLRGFLAGSVDVVFRVRDGGDERFLICDYKTNWLGPPDQPLTAAAYTPDRLAAAMGHSSYPLQALLYAVVLHRFLRWRLPTYDPERHLGGVLYLYLRGMCGPETPAVDGAPCGVFSWRPPAALVVELSDLLDGAPVGGAR
ncbi:exodeoxyribonuclease V beta subunit [Nocardioides thalensis]|uniref:RecBCD enzyme subunit RecB n=1 Tax=Nocardioides thalensis TaxID=1914755 RepID=A0A853CAN5_9ACTN|nr:UvrD-helicase domain-containing protein [Nocardioides thalensis]NYJ03273.1 exodeoxyribonuclease V beta subunit [Nocardioides thalensis]